MEIMLIILAMLAVFLIAKTAAFLPNKRYLDQISSCLIPELGEELQQAMTRNNAATRELWIELDKARKNGIPPQVAAVIFAGSITGLRL